MTELDKELFDTLVGRSLIHIARLHPNGTNGLSKDQLYDLAMCVYENVGDEVMNDYHLALELGTTTEEVEDSVELLADNVAEEVVKRLRRKRRK